MSTTVIVLLAIALIYLVAALIGFAGGMVRLGIAMIELVTEIIKVFCGRQ